MAVDHAASNDTDVQAAPAAERRAGTDPVAERLALLRAGGNRALGLRLAARHRLQRVGGWPTSKAPANQAEGTHSGVRRIPVTGLSGVARALVLLPGGLDPTKPVDVLVHLHGQNVGYENATPRDLDAKLDRFEEQLAASKRTQLVAVLPQGSSKDADYGEFSRLDPRAYAKQALEKLVEIGGLSSAPGIGSVVLSGHSGGGFAIKAILDDAARNASLSGVVWFDAIQAEAGQGAKRGTTGQREAAKKLVGDRVTAELDALKTSATDAEKEAALAKGFQFRVYYNASGWYAGAAGEIEAYLQALFGETAKPPPGQDAIATRIAALPAAARAALRRRYQTIGVTQSAEPAHSANLAQGKLDTLGHDNVVGSGALQDALAAMPFGTPPPPPAAPTTPPPARTTTPAPLPAPAPGVTPPPPPVPLARSATLGDEALDDRTLALSTAPGGILFRQPAPPDDVPTHLVEVTVALGHADGDPPTGTLLRRDDIRAALDARASNAGLKTAFDGAVQVISAFEGRTRELEYHANAVGLIAMLEDAFIHDPKRSAIDLLPPARAKHFRDMKWGNLDYPGQTGGEAAGPLEGEATAMATELAALRPERRPNAGADAVIVASEMTPAKRKRVSDSLSPVAGQPHHRLFEEAARAFERMAQVASYDSVELKILDSYRSPATAEANAAASGNPQAVAKFSSHTLGLAVDLQMSTATQKFLETTTHPMSNVAGMRAAEAHKWMVMRGAKFGWFPFGNEPWHWEYNPPGFRDRFRQIVDPPKAPAGAAAK